MGDDRQWTVCEKQVAFFFKTVLYEKKCFTYELCKKLMKKYLGSTYEQVLEMQLSQNGDGQMDPCRKIVSPDCGQCSSTFLASGGRVQ